jgi:hypothetical protein
MDSKLFILCTFSLEPFTLKLGATEVTLHNALEASPDPRGIMYGIQLGQDFLQLAVCCLFDVAMGDERVALD